jgi:hypothetical protein
VDALSSDEGSGDGAARRAAFDDDPPAVDLRFFPGAAIASSARRPRRMHD